MIAKIAVVLAVIAVVHCGEDAPPPKAHTYNVPVVSKVSYPGPAQTKSVETYSAPSIEKTTTITRTITAPINAPAERQVAYSAPAAPVLRSAGYAPALAAPLGFASPLSYGGQGLGLGLATTYSAPALGYSLGGPGLAFAAAPAYAAPVAYAAPIAYQAAPVAAYGAPAASYGAPAASYGAPLSAPSDSYGAPAAEAPAAKGGY